MSSVAVKPAGDDVGKIGDAWDPVQSSITTTAKAALQYSPGDPRVRAALQLGWLSADIAASRTPTPFADDLLTPETVRVSQGIELASLLTALALPNAPAATRVEAALAAGKPADADVMKWEQGLVGVLLGEDISLARAWALGRDLNVVAYAPDGAENPFRSYRVTGVLAGLDNLSSMLPSHAARGVANSIRRWQTAADQPADRRLAQCMLWRTILIGEKRTTELLEPENYIDAAERLATKLRAAATAALRQYAFWVAMIVILFLGGAAILLFVRSTAADTAAGLTAVLAAFGLTWKGVGTALSKLAANLEAPLWGAELDGAVTDAVTLLLHVVQPARSPLTVALMKVSRRQPSLAARRALSAGDYADRAAWRVRITPPQITRPPAEP